MSGTKQLEKLSVPPIGEMLIAGEYIVPQDLDFALDHQRYSKDLIGEILVRMGAVDRKELERILNLQKTLSER
jgi:hypothetical protein